ncbi:MAG: glycyl-radical enzyme activating protein [Anaerolineaceae bacterium]|nr:glycyl-radical enzyme activating protein [Anaerolineaceae bacterium]
MPLFNPDFGLISRIQKYSTKDGPGIRDTVFFKGCPLGCLWCSNPELIRAEPDLLYTPSKCISCGLCIDVCPQGALFFDDGETIIVDREKCTVCGECVDVCPEGVFEPVGVEISVGDVVTELLKDEVFYQTSGGGVTFSGGEPLYQAGFVRQVAERLKNAGIHTALDTAGDVSWCRFEEVLDVIDLVLYDIKTADRDLHRRLTGRDNDLILANAKMLSIKGVLMHIRMVMVPGINDSIDELSARMTLISELGNVEQIDLLPYHRYGVGKYAQLGLDYPLGDLAEYSEDQIERMRSQIASYGIPVVVGG